MIKILVENLRFNTIIGLLDFERNTPQLIEINAKFVGENFIDYAWVCEILQQKFNEQKFYKVEDALDFFKNYFHEKIPNLKYFYMKILKKTIIENADVGAEIECIY